MELDETKCNGCLAATLDLALLACFASPFNCTDLEGVNTPLCFEE
jgi:hypothetical protein